MSLPLGGPPPSTVALAKAAVPQMRRLMRRALGNPDFAFIVVSRELVQPQDARTLAHVRALPVGAPMVDCAPLDEVMAAVRAGLRGGGDAAPAEAAEAIEADLRRPRRPDTVRVVLIARDAIAVGAYDALGRIGKDGAS